MMMTLVGDVTEFHASYIGIINRICERVAKDRRRSTLYCRLSDSVRLVAKRSRRGLVTPTSCGPRRVLQNDAVAVVILEGATRHVPIRVERCHPNKSAFHKAVATGLPLDLIRGVKHQQVFVRGCRRDRMIAALGEFEMIVPAGTPKHDAVESLMILEFCQDNEVERCTIHAF